MIKTVRIEPATYKEEDQNANAINLVQTNIIVEFDVAELYKLYVEKGIDPSNVTVSYVVFEDGIYGYHFMNLKAAFDAKHEVSSYATILISAMEG